MRRNNSLCYQLTLRYASFLLVLFCGLILQACVQTQGGRTAQRVNTSGKPLKPEAYYAGYSKKYVAYRDKLAAGDSDAVLQLMAEEEAKIKAETQDEDDLVNQLRLIGLMERASLSLELGEPDKALDWCRLGQELIEKRASESYLKEGVSSVGHFFADTLGAGELARYDAPGYEKVMLLDLASMAYLLKGDDRAFNVARLAVEWQEEEKEKFTEELEKKTKEEVEGRKKASNSQQKQNADRLFSALHNEFSKYDSTTLTVPNAFVNPFGDYVTGMVDEFKSVKVKSLISNAHIAYKQALELNPKSKVLQQAVKDTKKRKRADRLIHIVALDGFVPEKKVLSIPIDRDIDVELPTFNPIPSKVAKIKVLTAKNKTLTTLSPVANIEALALRHQKDSLPYVQAMLLTSVVRDTVMVSAGDAILGGLGGLLKEVTDEAQEPDTTSWMTLPSTIMAGRFYAPKGLRTLKIRSYDRAGKLLAEKKVKLNKGNQHFVLVRSMDKTLYAYPSKKIWSPKS